VTEMLHTNMQLGSKPLEGSSAAAIGYMTEISVRQ